MNYFIYFLKGVSCVFIVLLHCELSGIFGDIIDVISRFGVPFFFMVSGFYLEKLLIVDSKDEMSKKMNRKIKKNLLLFMKSILLYTICYVLYYLIYEKQNWSYFRGMFFNKNALILGIVANKVSLGEHLWFISALLYYYIIVFSLNKMKKYGVIIRMRKFIYCISILLIGIILRFICWKLQITIFEYELWRTELYRNWLFTAIPFVGLGRWFYQNENFIGKIPDKKLILTILVGLGISFIERILVGNSIKLEIYIGIVLVLLSFFTLCAKYPYKWKGNCFSKIGQNYSTTIYIIHPIIILYMDILGFPDIMKMIAILVITLAAAIPVTKIMRI